MLTTKSTADSQIENFTATFYHLLNNQKSTIAMMNDYDRQMRMAAEENRQLHLRFQTDDVLNASINSGRSSYTHSIRTPDAFNEALIAGSRYNGRISNVRRFFCLFVTFDFLFTVMMWLICIMITGVNVQTAFVQQVVHYQMKSSLFDVVMAAGCRFTLLLLFYALIHIDHWIIVATSTASTCAFLLTKVFLYDWGTSQQPVFQVLLILTSFVLVWGEVWFLDIKVIPQESQAREWYFEFSNPERTPLLSPGTVSSVLPPENVGSFYTPIGTPESTDDEGDIEDGNRKRGHSPPFLPATISLKIPIEKVEECRKHAPELLKKCHDLITSEDWRIEKITSEGDTIYSMILPKPDGKIFKITGTIDVSASTLINSLFDNIENSTSWNKEITESRKIYTIDDDTDLVYQATVSYGNGAVGARDFVIMRHRGNYDSYLINTGISVNFSTVPNRKNYTRGENGIGCFATRSYEDKCQFVWILNTNLKGWIPQKMVDMSLASTMINFMGALRNYARTLED